MSAAGEAEAMARRADDSQVVLAQVMLPADANPSGNVHGGTLMKLADTAGAIAAMRHAGRRVVTVMVDAMTFEVPVVVGDLVSLSATVTWVGRTSIEVMVGIEAENIVTARRRRASTAYFVYVALDEHGNRATIPPLELRTDDERRGFAAAEQRRRYRLEQRGRSGSP